MTRDEALTRLRATLAAGRPIIGAGAGTGLSAKCEEAGGVDLIIVYNGASSMERLPVETAIADTARRFKQLSFTPR